MKRPMTYKQFIAKVDGPKITAKVEKILKDIAKAKKKPRNVVLIDALKVYLALNPIVTLHNSKARA